MVVRVHNRTAYGRADAHVTLASCFTDIDQAVVNIAYDTYCRSAYQRNHSHLAGGKTQGCILSFLCHKLCAVSCGTNQLAALAGIQLNVVYLCTYRDLG